MPPRAPTPPLELGRVAQEVELETLGSNLAPPPMQRLRCQEWLQCAHPRHPGIGCGVQSPLRPYLTERIYQLVLESTLPHKIFNSSFTISVEDIKLTILWGSWLSKPIQFIHCVR